MTRERAIEILYNRVKFKDRNTALNVEDYLEDWMLDFSPVFDEEVRKGLNSLRKSMLEGLADDRIKKGRHNLKYKNAMIVEIPGPPTFFDVETDLIRLPRWAGPSLNKAAARMKASGNKGVGGRELNQLAEIGIARTGRPPNYRYLMAVHSGPSKEYKTQFAQDKGMQGSPDNPKSSPSKVRTHSKKKPKRRRKKK